MITVNFEWRSQEGAGGELTELAIATTSAPPRLLLHDIDGRGALIVAINT
jgi:hypothetical protein